MKLLHLSTALGLCSGTALAVMTFPDCVNGPEALTSNLVCNNSATPTERATAFIAAWTIDEKLANLIDKSPGVSRLGISHYDWWNEGLHGVAYSTGVNFTSADEYSSATSFAAPILMSAAFDDELINSVAQVISTEARAFSNVGRAGLDYWTPNINPYKDPRWGRGSETPGEDSFRIKGYVKAFIEGFQGDAQGETKVIATCKHYAANDLDRWTSPEGNEVLRHNFDAIIGMQDLVEYYLPPFEQCARDSNAKSFMCSYNSVNGTPACANTYLMETVLRDFWGWTEENQYITSDCNAVGNIYTDHHYAGSQAEAAAWSMNAGTDTACEFGDYDAVGAYSQSLLNETIIDRALIRQYEGLIRAGYFDRAEDSAYRGLSWADVNTAEAKELALRSAVEGIVLKMNDGSLPLGGEVSVALIGFWADTNSQMLGGYSGPPAELHSPLYAAQKLGLETFYASGPVNPSSFVADNWTTPALDAAGQADIILYFGGNDLSIAAEDKDRQSLAWPDAQLTLIQKLGALGKPLVVVELGDQNDDTPLLDNQNVSAILWAGYPGQDGGIAVLDIITGNSAPAGRLPTTAYPAEYADQFPMTDMSLRPSDSNPGRTYKWYNTSVLPFGFGLHYTTFVPTFSEGGIRGTTFPISDLITSCNETFLDLCLFGDLSIQVQNKGNTTSDFVALAFLSGEYGPEPYPIKELAAYTRLRGIKSGGNGEAVLGLTLWSLARVNELGDTVLYPGNYSLLLDEPTQDTVHFELTGDAVTLVEFPQPPDDLGEGNGHL